MGYYCHKNSAFLDPRWPEMVPETSKAMQDPTPAAEGTNYFICGILGHCPSMRIAVEVSHNCWEVCDETKPCSPVRKRAFYALSALSSVSSLPYIIYRGPFVLLCWYLYEQDIFLMWSVIVKMLISSPPPFLRNSVRGLCKNKLAI